MNSSQLKTSSRARRSCQNTDEKSESQATVEPVETKNKRRSNTKNETTPIKKMSVSLHKPDMDKTITAKPSIKSNKNIEETLEDSKMNVENTANKKKGRKSKIRREITDETVAKSEDVGINKRRMSNTDSNEREITVSSRGRPIMKKKARIESYSSYHSSETDAQSEEETSESDDSSLKKIASGTRRGDRKSAQRIVSDSDESQSSDQFSRRSERKHKTKVQSFEKPDLSGDETKTENKDTVENKPKRKSGRFAKKVVGIKNTDIVQTQEHVADESKPKRKRGRPSKRAVKTVESDVSSSEQDFLATPDKASAQKQKSVESGDEVEKTPKRKRGRPSTKVSIDLDAEKSLIKQEVGDCTPKQKGGRRSAKALDVDEKDDSLVTCQVCKQEMSESKFKKKHKSVHHGLCWTQHEEPIDFYNPQIIMDILSEKRRKHIATYKRKIPIALSFACFFCSEVKKSELGYYSHLLVCNRSKEEVLRANKQCDQCKQSVFLPHYRAHELKHMREAEVESLPAIEKPPTPPVVTGGKRSAAQRAKSRISEITANLVDVETREKRGDDDFVLGVEEDDDEEDDEEEDDEEEEDINNSLELLLSDDGSCGESDVSSDDKPAVSPGTTVKVSMSKIFSQANDLMFVFKSLEKRQSSLPLYLDLKPGQFKCVPRGQLEDYLPRTKRSMCMKYAEQDNIKLKLFSSESDGDRCVLFCGGPVFATDWCPHPLSLARSDEYLAIASQPNMDLTHQKNITQSYKSIIQVWKFSQLSCKEKENLTESPEMVFAIAHEEGAVWSLEWCPSGGYIKNERLGLLAAACSSGKVLLYAIPWLENRDNKDRVFHLKPMLVLQIDEYNSSPCRVIAWQLDAPHHNIYAGYGDGCVAIFDIQIEIQELKLQDNILLPINLFQAHLTELLLLTLCPHEGTSLLLTSGSDRLVKLWDLTDLTSPIHVSAHRVVPKRSTCGGFIPNLPLIMTGSDHTHYDDQSFFHVAPIREFAFSKEGLPRLPQISSSFTLAFSPFCCSLITGNEDGKALCLNYMKRLYTKEKKDAPYILLNSKLVPIDDNHGQQTKQNQSRLENDVKVSSYEDVCKEYKLDLVTRPPPKVAVSDFVSDFVNITACSWNNNVNNFQFVALGQKCGLVHIMKIHSHAPNQLDRFFNSLKGKEELE